MELGILNGQMDESIEVNGKMAYKMDMGSLLIQKELLTMEYGNKDVENVGLKVES